MILPASSHACDYHVTFYLVGKAGQHSLTECGGDVEQAKSLFVKK